MARVNNLGLFPGGLCALDVEKYPSVKDFTQNELWLDPWQMCAFLWRVKKWGVSLNAQWGETGSKTFSYSLSEIISVGQSLYKGDAWEYQPTGTFGNPWKIERDYVVPLPEPEDNPDNPAGNGHKNSHAEDEYWSVRYAQTVANQTLSIQSGFNLTLAFTAAFGRVAWTKQMEKVDEFESGGAAIFQTKFSPTLNVYFGTQHWAVWTKPWNSSNRGLVGNLTIAMLGSEYTMPLYGQNAYASAEMDLQISLTANKYWTYDGGSGPLYDKQTGLQINDAKVVRFPVGASQG